MTMMTIVIIIIIIIISEDINDIIIITMTMINCYPLMGAYSTIWRRGGGERERKGVKVTAPLHSRIPLPSTSTKKRKKRRQTDRKKKGTKKERKQRHYPPTLPPLSNTRRRSSQVHLFPSYESVQLRKLSRCETTGE